MKAFFIAIRGGVLLYFALSFLEGIVSFISPCILPMLPIYITYFAGGVYQDGNKRKQVMNAATFVCGFTIVFVLLGAAMGGVGGLLIKYQVYVNILCGLVMILFGLNYIGFLRLPLINRSFEIEFNANLHNLFSAFLLGVVFSVSWTPCVGVFLTSALMFAAASNNVLTGVMVLLSFSLGLGVPFIISAILLDKMYTAFDFIKKNYKKINQYSGVLLILMGLLMVSGVFTKVMRALMN